ncbi:MAG: protein-disulfide reductase DsbD [gamma proteobacterium symbiont of Bathyaustriella thionipta]|nr:protein-disulfide reductase DsbD [gamma proteobacterium symbiont of Bathyaustriella thionipta]
MHKFKHLIILLLIWLVTFPAQAITEDELLEPDQAFAISGMASGADAVIVQWKIADGYYLYQSKIKISSATPGIELGEPKMSAAKIKKDPLFGDVEIYRNTASIRIPLLRTAASGAQLLELKTISQGCADAGICYPPHRQSLLIDLPAQAASASETETLKPISSPAATAPRKNALADLASLASGMGLSDDGILSPEQAYQLEARVIDGQKINLQWIIADGTYLYHDKIKISLKKAGDQIKLGDIQMPAPDIKKNTITPNGDMGDVAIYHGVIDIEVPLVRNSDEADEITLTASYQGCADRGICYPPQKKDFTLPLPATSSTASPAAMTAPPVDSNSAAGKPQTRAEEALSETDALTEFLRNSNLFAILAAFFVLGLGLSLTPCIFPMIPILSGIIAGQGDDISTRKGFMLALVYVLSMAALYTLAGIIAGLTGANLQIIFQNPWILSSFAGIFVLLALSMFGFYDIQLPAAIQTRLTEASNRQSGGTYAGVAIMGFLSALIVGPCVAPPLAAVLIFIGREGDALLGGTALFAMSIGMGVPLLLLGASAGKLLPRAGVWMDTVKAVFGALMLGVAIWLLERILPTAMSLILSASWLIICGIYMGALQPVAENGSGWRKLWKGIGLVMVIYGAMLMIGAASGNGSLLKPLQGMSAGGSNHNSESSAHLQFTRVKTVADLNRQLAQAKQQGQPVMLDFYADWCASCKEMEAFTFSDAGVKQALQGYRLLQANVTANDEADKALLQGHFGMPGPPAIMFWNQKGEELRPLRVVGYKEPLDFIAIINRVQ